MSIKMFLIEAAYRKRGNLAVSYKEAKRFQEAAEKVWTPFDPQPAVPDSISAVDGSRNRKEFAGYILYAIGAGSVIFKNGIDTGKEDYLVDIDILKPEEYSESRLQILMGILEIKETLKFAKDVSYLLLDGSIVGSVIRPVVFSYELKSEIKRKVEELFNKICSDFSLNEINSKKFYGRIEKFAVGKDFPVAAGYLEYLEYLYSIYLLLQGFSKKIVAISKRSNSRNYSFDNVLPDIAVFNYVKLPVGYSNPVNLEIHREKKFKFPEVFEEKLRKFVFKSYFIKLPKGKSVYKVESQIEPEEIIPILEYFAVKGYPYPLRAVHENVKISQRDMKEIISMLKLRGITGREGLGE